MVSANIINAMLPIITSAVLDISYALRYESVALSHDPSNYSTISGSDPES